VQQRDERVVFAHTARPNGLQFGLLDRRGAEQLEGLVDEVAAEVVGDPRALGGGRLVLPAVAVGSAPALESRLEAMHIAEGAIGDEALDGEEVAVPAAILKDGKGAADFLRLGAQLLRVDDRRNERLVDDEVGTGLEGREALLEVGMGR
jgi:hypothetical protein